MKKEDLDALAGLYEGVYSPNSGEYLQEELELLIERGAPTDPKARAAYDAQVAKNRAALGNTLLYGNAAGRKPSTLSTPTNVRGGGTRKPAAPAPAAKPPAAKPGALTPAVKPAATSPAAKPAASAPGSAKVVPSSAKPAASAKPAGSAMDQWAAANPKLAAAKAERDRTRGTSATTNPLMKDFKDKLPAPKAPSPSTSSTAFAKTSPSLGSSSSPVKSAGTAAAAKPTTNQTSTAFSSPSLVKPAAPAPAAKPAATMQKRPAGPGTGAMTRGGASGDVGPNARTIRSSYEWGSKATLKDVASLYSSIYEGKKKDQDQDGDNDFADVRIARMIASGMSKAQAIAAVKNKEYNEEFESWVDSLVEEGYDLSDYTMDEMFDIYLDEAEGSYGSTPKAYSAASKTKMTAKRKPFLKKMLSRTNPANRTSPYGSPRRGMSDEDRERARAGSKHGVGTRQDHDYPSEGPGGVTKSAKKLRKQKAMGEFGEAYEIDEAAKRTPKKTRGAKDPVAYMKGRSDAGKRISGDEDTGPRYYTLGRARGAEADAPTQPGQKPVRTPKLAGWEKDDIQYRKANLKAGKTHKVGGEKGLPEEYEIYEIVASYLLENNFAATVNDANVIIENMSEVWLDQILSEAPGEWFGGLRDKARASRAAQMQSSQPTPKPGPTVSSPFAKPASRNDSGSLTTYGAGGGAAAERRGQTRSQVMQQGAKNLENKNRNPGPNFGR